MSFNIQTNLEYIERDIVLNQRTISDVCDSVINTIKSGLPEEAHTIEVFDYVLEESKKRLRSRIVDLK